MEPNKIIYRHIVINERNVTSYRNGQNAIYGGLTDVESRNIYIYTYSFDEKVKLPKRDPLRRELERINQDVSKNIIHEKKHLANLDYRIEDFARTYYEAIMLYCLDEISARTDEFLINNRINTRNVVRAMRRAANQFIDIGYFDVHFLPRISSVIADDINSRGRYAIKTLNLQNIWYLAQSPNLYSEHFHMLERHYFTFEKFCVFDHLTDAIVRSPDWQKYMLTMEQIRAITMTQLHTAICTILAMHHNGHLK